MNENIISILKTLTVDFFTAFGLYSFLFLISSIFIKKATFYKFDEEAKKFISFVGFLYIILWFLGVFVYYIESSPEERTGMINRMFGKYWFGIWIQPIFWFLLSQIFRIKLFSKNILIRIFASFFLIFSIERLVIISTSLHRDYLPSSWTMYSDLGIYSSFFILSILLKILFFMLFVWLFTFIANKINQLRNNK
jgi:molybdopterin-containing oxidoreductase family membrane subunit